MGLKKFGTGDGRVTETEDTGLAKTAGKQDWTEADEQALARENAEADGQEG
jgi:hypothetical protein